MYEYLNGSTSSLSSSASKSLKLVSVSESLSRRSSKISSNHASLAPSGICIAGICRLFVYDTTLGQTVNNQLLTASPAAMTIESFYMTHRNQPDIVDPLG